MTCAWPRGCSPVAVVLESQAMLTDYHVHLRADDQAASAQDHFTAQNAARYRAAAGKRGVAELGVSEHIYRFTQALEVWRHPFWRENAVDDLDAYCTFVREHTDLRLGIEADYIPGCEQRIAALLERYDFDYVVGSVHFVAAGACGEVAAGAGQQAPAGTDDGSFAAVDMEPYGAWQAGWTAEQIWERYFTALGQAAASGLFDILGHPDLVKVFGAGQPVPEGDLRRFYELAMPGIAESGIAVEVSTAGLRKPVGEIYPARELLGMCIDAGAPVALSSDAHSAELIGFGYEQALALLDELGVREICVFDRRRRRMEPLGPSDRPVAAAAKGLAGAS